MFGYGCPTSIDLAEGLSSHTDKITIVKDNNGNVYIPEFGFNGIGVLTPGYGYQIKVTEEITDFSLCDWYVNDIPEDNIISLQEEVNSLQEGLIELQEDVEFMSPYFGCMDFFACNYNSSAIIEYEACIYPLHGYNCNGDAIVYEVGDYAHGGIIFYVDESGEHGLVASMEDLGQYMWGCLDFIYPGLSNELGAGYQNTMNIVNHEGCSTESPGLVTAAQAAIDAEMFGYNDWYLPSRDELIEMYNTIGNGGPEGNIGGFALSVEGNEECEHACWYWSSTGGDWNFSVYVSFVDGSDGWEQKNGNRKVRVIRSF